MIIEPSRFRASKISILVLYGPVVLLTIFSIILLGYEVLNGSTILLVPALIGLFSSFVILFAILSVGTEIRVLSSDLLEIRSPRKIVCITRSQIVSHDAPLGNRGIITIRYEGGITSIVRSIKILDSFMIFARDFEETGE